MAVYKRGNVWWYRLDVKPDRYIARLWLTQST
jgi:hypothetical protein